MRVRNVTRGVLLGDVVVVADDSRSRRTGLLCHDGLAEGEGLWIVPCEAVHTFGMKFAIDVIFLNRKTQVLKIRKNMAKRCITLCLRAHSVLELPTGTLERTGTIPGDVLDLDQR
jgi:uncharacterized membrane protein (UPF0127 family)